MRRARWTGRALVAMVAMALLPASASGAHFSKPSTTVVAKRTGGAATVDGSRFAAWGGGSGRVAVLDERKGSRKLFGLGRDCDRVLPLSGSGARFLVNCGINGPAGVENIQYLLDAADGSATSLGQSGYSLLGRQWLQGTGEDQFGRSLVYSNFHTGDTITEGAGAERVPYDLDSKGLRQIAPAARNFVVGGSHALERVGRSIHLVGWADGDRTVHKCTHQCAPLSVEGGLALWTDGPRTLYGYAVGSGRRFQWRMPEDAAVRGSTSRRVYYLQPLMFDPQFFALRSFRWR